MRVIQRSKIDTAPKECSRELMINLETIAPSAREAGVVYTKPWIELVLDLAGYLPDRRLAELVALEPSAGYDRGQRCPTLGL